MLTNGYVIRFGYRMAATLFVQPLDLIKNRMQLSSKSEFSLHSVALNNDNDLG